LRLVLAREKSSYQAIVRSCRVEYATALFRDPTISLSEIAHRLGYSDLSAFTHAFNRWTGCSPSRFRRELESRASATTRFDH
jgi:AraC-like DNA-binding protein